MFAHVSNYVIHALQYPIQTTVKELVQMFGDFIAWIPIPVLAVAC